MNDRAPVEMVARAVLSWLPPVRSRPRGRAVPTLLILLFALIAGTGMPAATQAQDLGGQRQRPRDTPAQTGPSVEASRVAMISGRVVDGRTGQALPRAQVVATARETRGRRYAAQTDQSGRYVLSNLTAGRFTVTVSKPGYVTLSYGQRRPRQPSTPVQVATGEHLENLDLALPAGSVITGQVVDEDGAALPLVTVRVLRDVYRQGQQQLVPVGTDRTDDRGQYRVFGLEPGATLSGSVVFETTQGPPSDMAGLRVTADTLQNIPLSGNSEGRIDEDGTFEMRNVSGGPKLIRARGVPNGWMIKAVYLDGQDVIDTPLEFSGVARADGFRVVLTDQVSRIGGIIQDRGGAPLTDYTVVAFPFDDSLWQPRSRYIKAARPDQNARYEIEGLPAGNYLLAAVDAVQEGEWFDPRFLHRLRSEGIRMSLNDGESKDLNLALDALGP